MTWVLSPLRDICWIWSGFIIGIALLALPAPDRTPILMAGAVLAVSHHFSPMVMAWSNAEFRATMRRRWLTFIGWPLLIVAVMGAIGAATALGYTSYPLNWPYSLERITNWRNPLPVIYWGWLLANAYHFGGQWYGVARLYLRKWRISRRCGEIMRWGFVVSAITAIVIIPYGPVVIPAVVLWLGERVALFWLRHMVYWTKFWPIYPDGFSLWLFGAISLQHWLTDIGLTQGVVRRWWVLPLLLALGTCALYVQTWTPDVIRGHLMTRTSEWFWPIVYSMVIATSVTHFIYSRAAWRHGTPFMRAVLHGS